MLLILFVTGFRRGGLCHQRWLLSLNQEAQQSFGFLFSPPPCEVQPLSNHEEQLSCPASWCTHSSAAVSGLLWHQMAVSVLRSDAMSFFRLFSILTLLYIQQRTPWRCVLSRGAVFYGVGRPWQLWNFPQHSSGCSRCVCVCVSDEGDNRLAGISSSYEWKLFWFINSNAASAAGGRACISVPRSQVEFTPLLENNNNKRKKMSRRRGGAQRSQRWHCSQRVVWSGLKSVYKKWL